MDGLPDTHRAVQQAVSHLAGPATAGQPARSHRTGTGNDYERHRATADHLLAARGGALRFEAIAQELGTDPVEREQGSLGGRPIWCSCAAWRRRQADFMQGCNPLPSVLFDRPIPAPDVEPSVAGCTGAAGRLAVPLVHFRLGDLRCKVLQYCGNMSPQRLDILGI